MNSKPKSYINKNMRTIAPIKFTKEGLAKVQQEYDELMAKRPGLVQKVKVAREMGDLSENAAYHEARKNLFDCDRRLRTLKMNLIYGVIDESTAPGIVGIGSHVTLTDGKTEKILTIVGAFEANPLANKISDKSPIGQALLGKSVGDTVTITVPSGTLVYTVTAIA